jgi:acetyltransferase-like isoleucine patch superfamily enzyme
VRNYDFKTKLSIGKYCSFAARVSILLGGEHRLDMASTFPFADIPEPWPETEKLPDMTGSKGDISIGNDVWIGHGVTILSGITIGDGAVVGASALICQDIEPYSIVGGNPAKTIKMRFDDETISRLMKLAWWDWPEEKVHSNIHLICNPDIESLLSAHGC